MIKKTIVAVVVAAALGSGLAQAQQPAAPASPHTLTGNVGIYSQYIFRGLTQTNGDPAVQGGFDYSHSSGFYAGTWASNISWLRDNFSYLAGGSAELDFYGGWKWGFAPDFTLDLGTLYYWYPGDVTPGALKADAWEIYAGLSWKWLSAKFSYNVANKNFQFNNSDGSWYLDLSANVPIGSTGITAIAHWGKQEFKGTTGAFNNDTCSYDDWKVGLTYALPKDFTIGAFYTDTHKASNLCYGNFSQGGPFGFGKNIAKSTGTVYIQKTF